MLENLVAWVLNNYLGKYVENLNTDQLSIALLSGEVELENLPLRKDALRHIGLPIQVRAGFIGKVKLQIPVSQIRSAPWMIVIEQLYLVAGPVRLSEWYADAEEIISQELKQAALDAIEARWRAEIETAQQSGYYASSYSSWVNYGTGLMTNIVENLQLKIKDVHIRYEDDITVPGQSFACGFTIHSLSAQSCDSNWAPGFTQWDSSSASFKLVELSDLAIYWDAIHPPEGLLGDLNISDLTNAMCPNISSSHEYILKPVSAKAYIKRDRSEQPLRSRLKPRIACDLNLEEVPLSLIDRQYEQMVRCIRGLDEIARLRRYRLYRPCTTIKEDARAWWIYAIRCISGPQRCPSFCLPKPTWDTCLERAKENVKYVDIYSKILTTPSAALGAESKALKDSIEWNRTLEELKALREVSMKKVPKPTPTAVSPSQGRSMLARWFPQWWYSTPSQEKSLDSPETANVAKTQLEDELLDALADTFENNTLLKRDSVFGQFNFTLKQGTFYLCTIQESSAERTSMIELQYENVKLCIESRPRTASHKFEITLGALYLRDKLTPDTQFPVLIAPQCREQGPVMTRIGSKLFTPRSSRLSTTTAPASNSDPLFQLCYEQKPFNSTVDYRIQVKSRSLDIVYNPGAAQWLAAFLAGPHQQRINLPTRSRLGADLIKNWEHILEGNQSERKSYDLQFDISAPQIIFVEQFSDRNAAVAVIDFGRLLLSNKDKQQLVSSKAPVSQPVEYRDSEDDDNFQTPCSTPPGSETSDSDPITTCTAAPPNLTSASLTDLSIHEKLYESYCVELNDLQILIGKVRDNWKYAHTKGTSALHVLDRFNISLQIERRVIYTTDPQYPTFTLNANLPKLVVHVNEQKIFTIRKLYNIIISKGLPSPFKSPQNHAVKYEQEPSNLPENEQDLNHETLKILILQFSVDQMALEVQSRGRSIAELQVAGVRLGFTQRASDTSISLSVHGLLLVDALQTFGPDFELLIASHKHVGMDSVSGSLRDSEPCSPTSPGSPDPTLARIKTTSPIALTQALSSLSSDVSGFRASSPTRSIASSPPSGLLAVNARGSIIGLEQLDVDALILIEVLLIGGPEPLQHANIQFNNLDIIANQETIVELMGFVRRVFPQLKSTGKQPTEPHILKEYMSQSDGISLQNDKAVSRTKTEILFDFHRLNVLLLRGVMKDNTIQGRKIATATMSEAKIQATVDTSISVEGSLGGLQILDLTPEGHTHQRIISVGKDPLVEQEKTSRDLLTTLDAELYTMGQNTSKQIEDQRAFSFTIKRQLQCEDGNAFADVKIRMASLWYTHSPQFLMELQSCATEFKQYLTNLARSIKSAATDMAMGLVHARAEALAHSLYMNSRFTGSMHGMSAGDVISPRRRKRSNSQSSEHIEGVSGYTSFKGTTLHTPYSPEDEEINIEIKLDIVLDSPVVILPKTSMSSQVFVAHLGKITINNNNDGNFDLNQTGDTQKRDCNEPSLWDSLTTHTEYYNIDIRDMKLYSLDISNRRMGSQIGLSSLERVEELYSCSEAGQPILHDTVLKLTVIKRVRSDNSLNENFPSLLMGHSELDLNEHDTYFSDNIQISGCVVSPLKVSLTKSQYEQVLDTFHTLVSSNKLLEQHESLGMRQMSTLGEIVEEDSGLTTLSMDSQLRSRLFTNAEQHEPKKEIENKLNMMKVSFKVPELTFELRGNRGNGEQGLVDLSFQDFVVEYEKFHRYETNIQVSLRSLLMEDLLRPPESKHRCMVISSATNELQFGPCYLSQSCPDLTNNPIQHSSSRGSLPDHLETKNVFGAAFPKKVPCPRTPPPSPNQKPKSHDNLVLISCLLVDPNVPNFKSHYNSLQRYTAVDFNCLDMVISVESWVIVLDFFGVDSKNVPERKISTNIEPVDTASQDSIQGNSELLVEVRSLTLVFIGPEQEVAKANISNLSVDILDRSANISGNFHPSELQQRVISGQLGSMSLYDLTPHGHLYRERFVSAGQQALNFNYIRLSEAEAASSSYDTQLCLEMSSVLYVHTKRFVREIQTFFAHFSQLQSVMSSIRSATQGMTIKKLDEKPLRLSIELHAGSPVILLPVSSRSSEILVADLGKLTVSNCFQFAGSDQNTNINKTKENRCLLNIMYIDLVNMDLYAAKRAPIDKNSPSRALGLNKPSSSEGLELGASRIVKQGPSLLTEKCHLKLRVEKNLHSDFYHDVADMSIQGTLSTLEGALDLSQYKLIRGLLAYNLGEDIADLTPSSNNDGFVIIQGGQDPLSTLKDVWTVLFIRLDLVNVNLRLCISHEEAPLACINFIKSKLTIETFSNATEDIDLASQEIQLMDMRFNANPINKRSNVFTNILQSIHTITQNDNVQAEIHSRRRSDHTKHTILLNNMRLMAILDWWEAVRDFIFEPPELPPKDTYEYKVKNSEKNGSQINSHESVEEVASFELKLNITDSEVVIVEDTSQWDTNAVILKSTTVISYRPSVPEKPLSCNLNHCEMFSCILGMEDETALSIIDPVTVNMEVNKDGILEVQLQHFCVRLSYHDMMMFMQIVNSVPKQTKWAKSQTHVPPTNSKGQIANLSALGFSSNDCIEALETCEGKLEDAALWLTKNANVLEENEMQNKKSFKIMALEIKTSCLSLCIIDDCRDADVPLIELSLSELTVRQVVNSSTPDTNSDSHSDVSPAINDISSGWLECVLAGDYYNRVLSGWEPFIEPWKCEIGWEYNLQKNRLQLDIRSPELLNFNITSTLIDLYSQVKDTWTQDYYNISSTKDSMDKQSNSPPGYRRRSPFVPFALKNDTGSKMWFSTMITTTDKMFETEKISLGQPDESWKEVQPGETIPFTFEGRGKLRHQDTHKLRIHQLKVKVEGWRPVKAISVDKVGIYFRHATSEIQKSSLDTTRSRIVFAVDLEGSARKLITVRSALLLKNHLPDMVEINLKSNSIPTAASLISPSKSIFLPSQGVLSIPLSLVNSSIFVRPVDSKHAYMYPNTALKWSHIVRPGDIIQELYECRSQRDQIYRFCLSIHRENYPWDRSITSVMNTQPQPAHTLTLRSPILITNLLPHDLRFSVVRGPTGTILPSASLSLHEVDMDNLLEFSFHLDNFPGAGTLLIPPGATTFNCRVRIQDQSHRSLFLNSSVVILKGCGIEITITSPFWIINKTGIPLIFRQEGVTAETAGQFEEHEIARMVAPLLFSLSDPDASPTVVARVGNCVVSSGNPQWCQHFHLQPGIQTRKLRVTMRDNRPDIIYLIGIDVRTGRGRHRDTNIVTISPKFQLHNKSSFQLQFAQKYFATTLNDLRAQATYLQAVPNCHLAFHWPRLDKDQLLCVRILDISDCCWSGGFRIDSNHSLHINIRDINGRMYFLRLDIVLQGATFFIVFTDADTMPPPIRIDNYSEVPLTFSQACCKDTKICTARAHSSVPYALDEPTEPPNITVIAPGGITATYDMNKLGEGKQLTYENFIYISFYGTFKGSPTRDPFDIESQHLVLDVGAGGRIILAQKQPGHRSQLWRMSSSGQLQHEGSSPPRPPQQPYSDKILVLDIEGPAPQPRSYTSLMLRRADPRRRSTQTWRFTDDGRLCCAHSNMCVQAKDGFFGLRQGSTAVLGMINPSASHRFTETGIPLEQAVGRQRLRPGSGFLKLEITTDGPTRVLKVYDIKEKRMYAVSEERDWANISVTQRPNLLLEQYKSHHKETKELDLTMQLSSGIGVSIVSRRPAEELLFAHLKGIILNLIITDPSKNFNISVEDIQIDNQLFETSNPVLVNVTKPTRGEEDKYMLPALRITAEILSSPNENAVIYKHLIVSLKPLAVNLEERLILKLFAFASYNKTEQETLETDENDYEIQRILTEVTATHSKRYYFGIIKLAPHQIRLSMMTANKLPPQLQIIKKKLRLTLINFEDAAVDLEPFVKQHPFESSQFLINSILKHFKDEIKWQAAIILGSVDFLGNPLGFVNDVTEGVSGLIYEGSVGALVKNVTHGISNSAAKVTESLSDGLGKVTMDDEHEETRIRIRQTHSGSSSDHLVAGIKGLGFGILGGATGIFKQIYDGATNEGIPGVFSGIGKGLVGAVTKPVVGVLDLASETARAVRDSSRSSSRVSPPRFRPPRCVIGPGGLLPNYSKGKALGQQHLYTLNSRNYSEILVAYKSLRSPPEDLRVIVTSEFVRVVTNASSGNALATVIEVHLSDLIYCTPITMHEPGVSLHYIELSVCASGGSTAGLSSTDPVRRPQIRCDSKTLANWVSQQINYAKSMYEERLHTLIPDVNTED